MVYIQNRQAITRNCRSNWVFLLLCFGRTFHHAENMWATCSLWSHSGGCPQRKMFFHIVVLLSKQRWSILLQSDAAFEWTVCGIAKLWKWRRPFNQESKVAPSTVPWRSIILSVRLVPEWEESWPAELDEAPSKFVSSWNCLGLLFEVKRYRGRRLVAYPGGLLCPLYHSDLLRKEYCWGDNML